MYTSILRLPPTSSHEGRKLCSTRPIIARSTLHNSTNWLHNGSNWFCRVIVILLTLSLWQRPDSRKPPAFTSDIHLLNSHFKNRDVAESELSHISRPTPDTKIADQREVPAVHHLQWNCLFRLSMKPMLEAFKLDLIRAFNISTCQKNELGHFPHWFPQLIMSQNACAGPWGRLPLKA